MAGTVQVLASQLQYITPKIYKNDLKKNLLRVIIHSKYNYAYAEGILIFWKFFYSKLKNRFKQGKMINCSQNEKSKKTAL